jgi:hypothetical protein
MIPSGGECSFKVRAGLKNLDRKGKRGVNGKLSVAQTTRRSFVALNNSSEGGQPLIRDVKNIHRIRRKLKASRREAQTN